MKLTPFAQELRKNATKQERHLWYDYLKNCPHQFKRQRVFGRFILDFYCPQAKLAVELDGGQHYEAAALAQDAERTAYLNGLGIAVLHISNCDVDRNFTGVCAEIEQLLGQRLPVPSQTSSPEKQI